MLRSGEWKQSTPMTPARGHRAIRVAESSSLWQRSGAVRRNGLDIELLFRTTKSHGRAPAGRPSTAPGDDRGPH